MARTDADATARITAALFTQLLNKLMEKGVIAQADVKQMMDEAEKVLRDPTTAEAFDGLGGRYDKELHGV